MFVVFRDPATGTVVKDIPVVISVVTAADTATDITSTTLGTSCKLKMVLTHNANAGKKSKGLFRLNASAPI